MATADTQQVSTSAPYYDLGGYRREALGVRGEEARLWCNRGLIWSYAFNHEESERCFRRALAADAGCAFAHWGVAYALGPNYNVPWDSMDSVADTARRGRRALQDAKDALRGPDAHALPVEAALVTALEHRFPDPDAGVGADGDKEVWNRRYAEAMGRVYEEFPDDLDVAALYADALMNLTPWKLWDLASGKPARAARTLDAKAVLDRAIARDGGIRHPGLLHLYIHLMEMSPTPEAALPAANALRGLVPDSGHLNHMPSHIDVLVGDYENGIRANEDAIVADDAFLARAGPLNFYTLYRMHDLHFRIYCAMFAGQSRAALESAARIQKEVGPAVSPSPSEGLLRRSSPPMADWLESFAGMRVHVLVRFGRWDELIGLPLPRDRDLYCFTTALTHYGRGLAYAATGRVGDAEREREAFRAAAARVPASRTLFNNTCADILGVASAMLDGEVEYRRSRTEGDGDSKQREALEEAAFAHLRKAVRRSRALPYDEPWGFMQPPCHALGALLVERGRLAEALPVYEEDLGLGGRGDALPRALRHPRNVWALHGYHECLVGLGRAADAAAVRPLLERALAAADVPIRSSCFCRAARTRAPSAAGNL